MPGSVRELFDIDYNFVLTLANRSNYWQGVAEFYLQIMDQPTSSITEGQHKWLTKIEEDLLEKREKLNQS